MNSTIEVCCKNTRHARGKIAKIGTFTHNEQGWWDFKTAREHARGGDTPYQCKLCGRRLPIDPKDHLALYAALDHIAAQRESEAELWDLLVLASRMK